MLSSFVQTCQVCTKSVYPDVIFQHLLKNVQLFSMLLLSITEQFTTHTMNTLHENCQYNYSHTYEWTWQHNHNTHLNSIPAKKIDIQRLPPDSSDSKHLVPPILCSQHIFTELSPLFYCTDHVHYIHTHTYNFHRCRNMS